MTKQPPPEAELPFERGFLCISCAAKLGGKVDRWLQMDWKFDKCDSCGNKCEITNETGYMWR